MLTETERKTNHAESVRKWQSKHNSAYLRMWRRYGPFKKSRAERFWSKVNKTEFCWLWEGNLVSPSHGLRYGKSWDGKRGITAHRQSWEIAYGEIPNNLFVLHKCDNPPCVRPSHLYLGTHQENMKDMISKKRAAWQKKAA